MVGFKTGVRQVLPALLGTLAVDLREQMENRLKQLLPDIVNGHDPLFDDFKAISACLVSPTY